MSPGSSLARWLAFASPIVAAGVSTVSAVLLLRLWAALSSVAPVRRACVSLALCLAPAAGDVDAFEGCRWSCDCLRA